METSESYFMAISSLQEAGRIVPTLSNYMSDCQNAADNLLVKSWITKLSQKDGIYYVPSEFTDGMVYKVKPGACFCTCFHGQKGILCKHIQLVLNCNRFDKENYPSLDSHLSSYKEELVSQKLNSEEDIAEITVFNKYHECECYASALKNMCTCTASSYWNDCGCIRLARELFPATVIHAQGLDTKEDHCDHDTTDLIDNECRPTDDSLLAIQRLQRIQEKLETMSSVPNGFEAGLHCLEELVFLGPFPKKRNKVKERTYKSLHPERRLIRKKMQPKLKNAQVKLSKEHSYHRHSKYGRSNAHLPISQKFKRQYSKKIRSSLKSHREKNRKGNEFTNLFGLKIPKMTEEYLVQQKAKCNRPEKPEMQQNFLQEMCTQARAASGGLLVEVSDQQLISVLAKFFEIS